MMRNETERMIKDKVFSLDELQQIYDYLDALRSSGAINMFGAAPYVAREFGLTQRDARRVWSLWVDTFNEKE